MKCLIDTNILIDILDRGDEDLFIKIVENYPDMMISWVTLFEYLLGVNLLGENALERKREIEEIFEVLYPTQEDILEALRLEVELRRDGLKIPDRDLFIAAQARNRQLTIIAKDKKHFKHLENYKVKIHIL